MVVDFSSFFPSCFPENYALSDNKNCNIEVTISLHVFSVKIGSLQSYERSQKVNLIGINKSAFFFENMPPSRES